MLRKGRRAALGELVTAGPPVPPRQLSQPVPSPTAAGGTPCHEGAEALCAPPPILPTS